jgi:hypothetical protein
MEDRVESLEKVKKVLEFIKPYTSWGTRLYDNEFTEMVYKRHVVDSNWVLKGKMGLLEIWCHNFTHLHEKSSALNDEDEVEKSSALNDEDEVYIMIVYPKE